LLRPLRAALTASLPLAATMPVVLLFVSFVLLSSRLLSPGRSAITAQLPAFAASRSFV
jgi:hypothetical protein